MGRGRRTGEVASIGVGLFFLSEFGQLRLSVGLHFVVATKYNLCNNRWRMGPERLAPTQICV
jgi:hypothetical protein